MTMTESEERASNAGFERGLKAGRNAHAKQVARSQPASSPKPPEVSLGEEQALTWSLLLILAIVVVWISPWGSWLQSIVSEITVFHPTTLNFNPIGSPPTSFNNAATGGGGGGGNAAVVHGFNIPLTGGGSVTVNSTSLAGAQVNAAAETGIQPA